MVIDVIAEYNRSGVLDFLGKGKEFPSEIFTLCLEIFFTFLHRISTTIYRVSMTLSG